MSARRPGPGRAALAARSFAAGAVAVLTTHQAALWALHAVGLAPWRAYDLAPTRPLGIPALWSAAFWGGLWGVVLVMLLRRAAGRGRRYWRTAAALGAVLPTGVGALLIAAGRPFPEGANAGAAAAASLLINAVWGLTVAALTRPTPRRADTAPRTAGRSPA